MHTRTIQWLLVPALLWFLACAAVVAQKPYFLHYGTKEGLLTEEVYNLLQDTAGFIWIASDHGVSRFDGAGFKHFSIKDGLPSNVVTELFLDRMGRVWFHAFGNSYAYIQDDSVHVPAWNKVLARYQYEYDSFGQLKDGRFAIGVQNYDPTAPLLYLLISENGDDIEKIWPNVSNQISVTLGESIQMHASTCQIMPDSVAFQFTWGNSMPCDSIQLRFPTSNIKLDIYTPTADSVSYIASNSLLYKVDVNTVSKIDLDGNTTNSLFVDREKNLWVGLFKNGVRCFENGDIEAPPTKFLDGYSVTSVMQDQRGGYWFSTIEAGIFHMPFPNLLVYTSENGLPENRIVKALKTDTLLWMIYRNGYVTRSSIQNRDHLEFETVVKHRYIGPSFIDSTQQLNISVSYPSSASASIKEREYASALYFDSKGSIYEAFVEGGFIRAKSDGSIWVSGKEYPGIGRIKHITESAGETIWLGSMRGLYQFQNDSLSFLPERFPFALGEVSCLLSFEDLLFFGVGGKGMYVLQDDSLTSISSHQGLSSDFIHRIVIDSDETVWLSTTSGIDYFKLDYLYKKHIPVRHIGIGNGLPSTCVNDLLVTETDLWAFTDGGLAIIPRSVIVEDSATTPLYLSSIKVNGAPLKSMQNLQLNHLQNNLQVTFQAIAYQGLSEVRYAYRLLPGEDRWNFTQQPVINLSGLNPGSYILEIQDSQALDRNGVLPLQLHLTIAPPFWKRWYVVAAASLTLLLGFWFLSAWRIRQLKWTSKMEQQVSTLSFRALQAQMNPHFIYNALNAIQNFILKNEQQASLDYLNKFSRLVRLVFDHSSRDLVTLYEELENISLYVNLEQARYPDRFDFEVDMDPKIKNLKVAPMLLQPFIENAILHGILPAGKKGKIVIRITVDGKKLHVQISDNGIGIRKGMVIKRRKERFLSSGSNRKVDADSGLQVTKKRIHSLAQKHGIPELVKLVDRSELHPDESGTLVSFYLPTL